MKLDEFFSIAWKDYLSISPSAGKIVKLLEEQGEKVVNDHIALRTFAHEKMGKNVMAEYFQDQGYEIKGEYDFPDKQLKAIHLELNNYPKIFISELLYKDSKFSTKFSQLIDGLIETVSQGASFMELYKDMRPWKELFSYKDYLKLSEESEYGAWMGAIGIRPNHFTVFLNQLKSIKSVEEMNSWLKEKGFPLNSIGGEVKGSPEVYLEQSSIMADSVEVDFSDGVQNVPSCYYEFAFRYPMESGDIYQGFVAKSAGSIFESTNRL